MKIFRCLFPSCAILSFVVAAHAAPLSGTRSVGPTGDYASLTAAITDVQAGGKGLGGALILELQPAYVSTVETFPLTIPALNGASAVNTLTIRPASGATALSISSADGTAATVDLNGAQFVTIDGRPGGMGSNAGSCGGPASQLTIANTRDYGVALRFINEASSNTVAYTKFRAVSIPTDSPFGTVVFSTTTGPNGNDNNTIHHCDIGDGASTSGIGINSLGTTDTAEQNNSGNTVSNCNIFNFYSMYFSAGVMLGDGSTDWTITGNSFYQTASRAVVGSIIVGSATFPIYINSIYGNNFTVTGNSIGGSAPNVGGTWTTTGTAAINEFVGIYLRVGTTVPSSVQGNTIANFAWTSSSAGNALPGLWTGIYVEAGSVNVGTVTGNTIGSGTGTGSVSITSSGNDTSFGIGSVSFNTVVIANNTIGSITENSTSPPISSSLAGISVTAGVNTISNNLVGSITTANSLNDVTFGAGGQVTGILSSSSTNQNITGNTVANLNNNFNGTGTGGGQIRGIVTTAGANTITGNTVRNLSTTSLNMGSDTSSAVIGISESSTTAGQTVSQNTVHSLANTSASAAGSMTGIYFAGSIGGTNEIERNLVHSLAFFSTNVASQVQGMFFSTGTFTAQNNMVRVGLKADGTSTAGASNLRGIVDNAPTAGRNFYHNSVYLGGMQTSGAKNTYAFMSFGLDNNRNFQNNIFVNARSNNGASGKHYSIFYGTYNSFSSSLFGLTAGGNIFLASGTGGMLGVHNGVDFSTLAEWQAATGQDLTSAVADPLFMNPTGTAATVDLHLQASNPAEGQGVPIAAVTDDFDGQTRSALTPVDIGADAGNFTLSSDVFAPVISYPLLATGSAANRVLTGWAAITDNVGVASDARAPRLYFKKSTDADFFGGANDATGNGWKYVTATGSNPYSFTIDYTLISGGSVSPGDTIQYFVVAQDAGDNLRSSPAGATASANPPVQNINAHGATNTYSIGFVLSGTKTVGIGGNYPNLTGAGGLFAAINGSVLTGNLAVRITSDTIEDGSNGLNRFNVNEYPPLSTYTLTIQPDSATMKTISGSSPAGLITLNGADRVTIDGRFGGTGRYLTFRNTDTTDTPSTICFINDASDNTVRNSIVEGGTGYFFSAVILFGNGATTGNDNDLITDNQVRDLSTTAGVPSSLIQSSQDEGSSASVANSNNTITNNELFNFNFYGVWIATTGNVSWTVSGNNIYEVNEANAQDNDALYGIVMQGGGTNVIMGNFIHDLLANDIGTQVWGIQFSGLSSTTISRNRITAINVDASTQEIYGIDAQGDAGSTLNVLNNQITLSPVLPISATLIGLVDRGFSGSVVNAFYNSILIGGTDSGGNDSWASLCENSSFADSVHLARNNIFFNNRSGGTGNHFAASSETSGASYTADYNVYVGTGATPASFMDFYNSTGPVTFATWQASTSGDANSSAGNPGTGDFTTAMFVNVATGDLHLAPGGNVLVNSAGSPVAGVTNDFDGDIRSLATPNIGSDEFVFNHAPVAGTTFTLGVKLGVSATVRIIGGKHPPTDADNDALTVTGVTGAANGITTTDGTNVTYTATGGITDSFLCAISDGRGGTANQTVNVSITSSGGSGYNQLAPQSLGGGTNVLTFLGTPGLSYALELATNLVPPIDWQPQVTNTAATNGWMIFTNFNSQSPVFYRTRYVP